MTFRLDRDGNRKDARSPAHTHRTSLPSKQKRGGVRGAGRSKKAEHGLSENFPDETRKTRFLFL